jgi:hypothetical protein
VQLNCGVKSGQPTQSLYKPQLTSNTQQKAASTQYSQHLCTTQKPQRTREKPIQLSDLGKCLRTQYTLTPPPLTVNLRA